MAGVWVFRNGVAKLVQNPMLEPIDGHELCNEMGRRTQKALIYLPTMEVISSFAHLEEKLLALGWLPYHHNMHTTMRESNRRHRHHRINHGHDDIHPRIAPHCSSSLQLHGHHHPHHLPPPPHDLTLHSHGYSHSPNSHHHHQVHHCENTEMAEEEEEEEEECFGRGHELVQFHRCFSSSLLISLPRDFSKFKTMHMYDIVLKNRQYFEVRDVSINH